MIPRLVSRGFWLDAFDFVGVDSEVVVFSDASVAMTTTRLGVATLMVVDSAALRFVLFLSKSPGKTDPANHHVGRSTHLLERQPLAVGDDLTAAQTMTNTSTEKLTDDRHDHMTVHAVPSATLEVIPAEFFFGFAKARFDFPASERHPQQLANRQAISTGDSIADEVLHFTSANILGNDQGALRTDHSAVVSLAVDDMPTNFPNLRTFLRVQRAVTLRCLRGQTGRVLGQVLHLASLRVAGGQARVLLLSFLGFISRLSQYFGLSCPCVKVGRNLTYERLLTFIKPIKKLAVTTVKFIKSPGLHRDAIGDHFVDQHQCEIGRAHV